MLSPTLRVLSLGAGLDSTTLLLMSDAGELPPLDYAIFADTQAEPPYVYETLEWLMQNVKTPIVRVTTGNLREDMLAAAHVQERRTAGSIGQPPFWVRASVQGQHTTADTGGMLWRKCTHDYKIVPIRRKIRELLGVKPVGRLPKGVLVEQWIGFTLDDLHRTFCSDVQWITNTFPLILPKRLRRRDLVVWLEARGYPVPQKSSCTFCPFHSNTYWRTMRDERPEEWHATVNFERQLQAGKLPGVTGTVYLHASMRPLDQAPIDQATAGPELFCYACNT